VQSLNPIIKNGQELSRLIDGKLDLSKVKEGRMEIEKKPFDVFELIDDITTTFQEQTQEKNIEITSSIHPRVPSVVYSDPKRLRQILVNIIGNAVKFTENGGIRLAVDIVQRTMDRPTLLAFKVIDCGIGISEFQESFKLFNQDDISTTICFGDKGSSLALSKTLAQSLGGDVELVESKAGVGSTLLVTIESGRMSGAQTHPIGKHPNDKMEAADLPLSDMKILVADDSKDNQILIKRILQRSGASVTTVSDGELAVREGMSKPYDAILMDMQMPVLDGYAATRKLRSLGVEIPIVALTAHAMQEEMQKSLAAGCTAHLTKPIDKGLLLRTLTTHTEQRKLS
jgi:CheY-like chemotaxis protein